MDPRELIPHREPFLFVTRVIAHEADSIVTEWDVDPAADFFRGHYPDNPIVPGVILVECALQAGALLCSAALEPEELSGRVPVVTRVGDARFKRMVAPGERVRVAAELTDSVGPARFLKARLTVDGATALRLEFAVALMPAAASSATPGGG
jgi:3-hydroxyacyl-[acyl-carrier-protein] dehydratase